MITSSNIVEFFELYLRPFLEQESRLTKELAADEAIAVYDDPVVRSMDGYEAAGRIRQYEKKLKRKHLPIIALTANGRCVPEWTPTLASPWRCRSFWRR